MSVLQLYRRLLRLHQRLPDDTMATIGRQFVREEFRKHKGADSKYIVSFMKEWTDYADQLEGQLRYGCDSTEAVIGRNLSPEELDMMSEQQLGQLLELKTETGKPRIDCRTTPRNT